MGLLDYVATPGQRVAYLFPEFDASGVQNPITRAANGGIQPRQVNNDVFIFQFWPSQITDNYTPNYATKSIPGGSHPLYQWVSGNGREISFTANFVTELREDVYNPNLTQDFNERIASQAAGSIVGESAGGINPLGSLTPALLPSSRYKVNVAAALAALQQYLYPTYEDGVNEVGVTKPPKKLVLVLPGTKLGRGDAADGILCILKAANVTMESFFPSGELRAATVALTFAEVVQMTTAGGGSQIKYIGAEAYTDLANKYIANNVSVSALEV